MNKKALRSYYNQSDYSNTNQAISNNITNLRLATICKVTQVNDNKLNAKPIVAESINQKDGEVYIELPEFKNVPYISGWSPKEGDICVCITLDRSYSGYDSESEEIINSNGEIHDISNCVAIGKFSI
jgi:hypothetical protein